MKKVGYFFLCFLPILAALWLQVLVTIPAMGISFIQLCFSNIPSSEKVGLEELMTQLTNSWLSTDFNTLISIGFALCVILTFSFWYSRQFNIKLKQSPKSFVTPKCVIGIILLVPGLQLLATVLTAISSSLFPGAMKFYEKLMESAGFTGNPSIFLILYAALLGPIGEEFIFRGVTLAYAKKALPFFAANLFQALLFGVFHMNLIQGIYAFFLGLFLGYICEKGGSIYLAIFLHILFNSWGTFFPTNSEVFTKPMFSMIFFAASILIGIVGFILFYKGSTLAKSRIPDEPSDSYHKESI